MMIDSLCSVRVRRLCCLSLLLFLTVGSISAAFASSAAVCRKWYRQKKYLDASRCFVSIYRDLKKVSKRTEQQNEQMAATLRNIGLILRKAALREKDASRAAFLREQAVRYLTAFLKGKRYTSKAQRSYTIAQRDSIKERIGYATLTILAAPKSELSLSGYKFSSKGKGNWSGRVRPGKYVLLVKSKGRTLAKEFTVAPNQPKVVRLMGVPIVRRPVVRRPAARRALARQPTTRRPGQRQPIRNARTKPVERTITPAPPKRSNVVPWVVFGTGLAIVAAGGVMTGLAFMSKGKRDEQFAAASQEPPGSRSYEGDTLAIGSSHREANTFLLSGILAGSVGVATATVGLILFGISPKTPPNAPPPTSGK